MPLGFLVQEDEDQDRSPLTKNEIEKRVADWLARLQDLYERISDWSLGQGWSADASESIELHEDMMRRFGVPQTRQPVLRVEAGGSRYALFKPRGLWVIGANGRIDLYTSRGLYTLVDISERFSRPNWMIVSPGSGREQKTFALEQLADLV